MTKRTGKVVFDFFLSGVCLCVLKRLPLNVSHNVKEKITRYNMEIKASGRVHRHRETDLKAFTCH